MMPSSLYLFVVSKQRMIIDNLQRLLVEIFDKKESDAEALVRMMLIFGHVQLDSYAV